MTHLIQVSLALMKMNLAVGEAASMPLRPLSVLVSLRLLLWKLQEVGTATTTLPQPEAPENSPALRVVFQILQGSDDHFWDPHCQREVDSAGGGQFAAQIWARCTLGSLLAANVAAALSIG